MIKIEDLGEPLAAGRTADIYQWSESEVIKLFQPWMPFEAIESERNKAAAARSMDLPVPGVGDIIHLTGRVGLVFERIDGPSMMDQLKFLRDLPQDVPQETLESSARQLAELQASLHAGKASVEFPAQADILRDRISQCSLLSEEERTGALRALARMPRDEKLCHGDFHPGNVMLADRGPVVIDWIDASRGNPAADIARTSLLFLGHIETSRTLADVRTAMALYHDIYLDWHLDKAAARRDEYRHWFPIMAAARLAEDITEQQDWLLQQVRRGLSPG